MSVTVTQIVQDALGILGEVTGVGTQTYSEPRMIVDAGRGFNLLFKKRWWEQYSEWVTVVLSGTTGIITTDAFTQVQEFSDIEAVHRATYQNGLPTLPRQLNPNILTGTTPQYWTSLRATHANYAGRKIKIYPITATGSLDVKARFHPLTAGTEWVGGTVLDLDRDLLALGCAFMALSGDDLNAHHAQTVQSMMDIRYKDVMDALGSQKMSMSDGKPDVPREWYTT